VAYGPKRAFFHMRDRGDGVVPTVSEIQTPTVATTRTQQCPGQLKMEATNRQEKHYFKKIITNID